MADNGLYEDFAKQSRAVIVAPAGCGKTELIARATAHCHSRQLILTHTHAGVDSLRAKLRRLGISTSGYLVETIHSFALRYASAYPKLSSIQNIKPETSEDYSGIIESSSRLLETKVARDVLQSSYSGVFIDEYQDCTVEQHELIMKIANLLPCRIVGDPLQGIFDFGDNAIVDWEQHVYPNFERLEDLEEPWRWKSSNPGLGEWLTKEVRTKLIEGKPILLEKELEFFECHWTQLTHVSPVSVLLDSLSRDATTFGICDPAVPHVPHYIAKKLKNRYRSIEPVTSEEICHFASSIEKAFGIGRLENALDFAKICLTEIRHDCQDVIKALKDGKHAFRLSRKVEFFDISKRIIQDTSLNPVLELFDFLLSSYSPTLIRHQLWREMRAGLIEVTMGDVQSLQEAVWFARNKIINVGRVIPKRCISRTVLLKGLECENAIVIDADTLDTKNLYVALTRGSNSLHILSRAPILLPKDKRPLCPKCSSLMVPRIGNKGSFLGCSNYPDCKQSLSLEI